VRLYHDALRLLPTDAVNDLAVSHNQLGAIYDDAGDLNSALSHYQQSLHFEEMQSNLYGASRTRFNLALAFCRVGRRADALEYAKAALRGFEGYGERAAAEIKMTHGLIVEIRRR
jgi:tetratricopeptide (TPR) repeat protein